MDTQNKLELIKEKIRIDKEKRDLFFKEYWDNLPTFTKPTDVPKLPKVDNDEWTKYYVPRLINAGAIPKKDLIVGNFYKGDHRRANVAMWDGTLFVYYRNKFGQTFKDTCNHFEDDDGFALFVPFGDATENEYYLNKIL